MGVQSALHLPGQLGEDCVDHHRHDEVTVRGMFAHVYGADGACGEGVGDGAHVVLGGANEVNESLY